MFQHSNGNVVSHRKLDKMDQNDKIVPGLKNSETSVNSALSSSTLSKQMPADIKRNQVLLRKRYAVKDKIDSRDMKRRKLAEIAPKSASTQNEQTKQTVMSNEKLQNQQNANKNPPVFGSVTKDVKPHLADPVSCFQTALSIASSHPVSLYLPTCQQLRQTVPLVPEATNQSQATSPLSTPTGFFLKPLPPITYEPDEAFEPEPADFEELSIDSKAFKMVEDRRNLIRILIKSVRIISNNAPSPAFGPSQYEIDKLSAVTPAPKQIGIMEAVFESLRKRITKKPLAAKKSKSAGRNSGANTVTVSLPGSKTVTKKIKQESLEIQRKKVMLLKSQKLAKSAKERLPKHKMKSSIPVFKRTLTNAAENSIPSDSSEIYDFIEDADINENREHRKKLANKYDRKPMKESTKFIIKLLR